MALSNADNPAAEEPKTAHAKTTSKPPAAPALGRASESGDAEVHFLLAQRETHTANGDTAAVEDIDKRLAELGLAV